MHTPFRLFALLLLFAVSGCYVHPYSYTYHHRYERPSHRSHDEDFEWRGRVDRGEAIEIKGVNGEIIAEPTRGNEVVVRATKSGRRSDPRDVRIEVVEHRDGVTICAVYPGRNNSCEPGGNGSNNVRNNDVKVRFVVQVPEGVDFTARTVNGEVEASRLTGNVRAYTVNGRIEIDTDGEARAETVNGAIVARMGRLGRGDVAFKTVNGSITVELPRNADAHVNARTVNGSIRTDFPIAVRGRFAGRRLEGAIGRGGPELNIATVNGAIRLLER